MTTKHNDLLWTRSFTIKKIIGTTTETGISSEDQRVVVDQHCFPNFGGCVMENVIACG